MWNVWKKIMDWVYHGLGFIAVLFFFSLAYAGYTWVNQSNLNTWDVVTAQTWNNVINNQNFLKQEVDTKFAKTGWTLSGILNMWDNKITNLATPTANTDAVTKAYADSVVASWGWLYQISCWTIGTYSILACVRIETSTWKTECKYTSGMSGWSANWSNCNTSYPTSWNPWN